MPRVSSWYVVDRVTGAWLSRRPPLYTLNAIASPVGVPPVRAEPRTWGSAYSVPSNRQLRKVPLPEGTATRPRSRFSTIRRGGGCRSVACEGAATRPASSAAAVTTPSLRGLTMACSLRWRRRPRCRRRRHRKRLRRSLWSHSRTVSRPRSPVPQDRNVPIMKGPRRDAWRKAEGRTLRSRGPALEDVRGAADVSRRRHRASEGTRPGPCPSRSSGWCGSRSAGADR